MKNSGTYDMNDEKYDFRDRDRKNVLFNFTLPEKTDSNFLRIVI